MSRVLITGATGFIGQYCLKELIKYPQEIHATYFNGLISHEANINWHRINLLAKGEITKLIEKIKPTHILHLAWYAKHNDYWHSDINYDWVNSTLELLNASRKNKVERIVGVGTCAEYDWTYEELNERTTLIRPKTNYSRCKAATSSLFTSFQRNSSVSTAWARIFYSYGPNESPDKLVSSSIKKMLNNEIVICQQSNLKVDYIYASDVASALVTLLNSNLKGMVNIGSGELNSLGLIVTTISNFLDKNEFVRLENLKVGKSIPDTIKANTNRLNIELGWEPQFSMEQGLMNTIEYIKNNL